MSGLELDSTIRGKIKCKIFFTSTIDTGIREKILQNRMAKIERITQKLIKLSSIKREIIKTNIPYILKYVSFASISHHFKNCHNFSFYHYILNLQI